MNASDLIMVTPTKSVEERFVELIRRTKDWLQEKEFTRGLDPEEEKVLLDLVIAAGFDAKEVKKGELRGDYLDQDGSRTGETFSINGWLLYIIKDKNGEASYNATGWLNEIFCLVRHLINIGESKTHLDDNEKDRRIATELAQHIEMSRPLKPIVITENGDELHEYPHSINSSYLVSHTRDDEKLSDCVGIHGDCNGWTDRGRVGDKYDFLLCRSCHLRVTIPQKIKTYGDLRKYFKVFNP